MKQEFMCNKTQEQKIHRSVLFILSLGTAALSRRRPATAEISRRAKVLWDTIIKSNTQYSNTELIIVKK
jgi:hypothetical protein